MEASIPVVAAFAATVITVTVRLEAAFFHHWVS
jgi:hypothetical protein